jgi:hypothetical protein
MKLGSAALFMRESAADRLVRRTAVGWDAGDAVSIAALGAVDSVAGR